MYHQWQNRDWYGSQQENSEKERCREYAEDYGPRSIGKWTISKLTSKLFGRLMSRSRRLVPERKKRQKNRRSNRNRRRRRRPRPQLPRRCPHQVVVPLPALWDLLPNHSFNTWPHSKVTKSRILTSPRRARFSGWFGFRLHVSYAVQFDLNRYKTASRCTWWRAHRRPSPRRSRNSGLEGPDDSRPRKLSSKLENLPFSRPYGQKIRKWDIIWSNGLYQSLVYPLHDRLGESRLLKNVTLKLFCFFTYTNFFFILVYYLLGKSFHY